MERVDGDTALVKVADTEACAACGAEGTCAFGSPRKGRSLWVNDPVGVRPGDLVRVEITDQGLLAASLILYGIPLAALLAGAVIGQVTGGEKRSFLFAALGLALSVPVVRLLGNRMPKGARFAARIVSAESAGIGA